MYMSIHVYVNKAVPQKPFHAGIVYGGTYIHYYLLIHQRLN